MIVFVNGSFGIGKSTLAERLVELIPNSMLYDAEEVGYMLMKICHPIDRFEDFQDLPAWRDLAVRTAAHLKRQYGRTLIMPMCIWNEQYFDEVTLGLKAVDEAFYHFCLIAPRQTILARLHKRNGSEEVGNWVKDRMEKCLLVHNTPRFDRRIYTDEKNVEQLANEVLSYLRVSRP